MLKRADHPNHSEEDDEQDQLQLLRQPLIISVADPVESRLFLLGLLRIRHNN